MTDRAAAPWPEWCTPWLRFKSRVWCVGFRLRWWIHTRPWIPIVWDWDNDRPRLKR